MPQLSVRLPLFRSSLVHGLLSTTSRVKKLAAMGAAAFMLAGLPAHASYPVDATSSTTAASTNTTTFNHTLGTGNNRLVVCGVQTSNPTTGLPFSTPTITFGGKTMNVIPNTQAPTSGSSVKIETVMFYLNDTTLGAASGSQSVVVTFGAAQAAWTAGCTSFFDIQQTSPETSGTYLNSSGSSAPAILSLTTATAGDLIIDSFAGGYSVNSVKTDAPNAGQTQLYNIISTPTGISGGMSYFLAGAPGATALGWTDSVSRLAYAGAAFKVSTFTVTPTVSPVGSGSITLSPSQATYPAGSSVTVTATPAQYYTFTNFTGDFSGSTNGASFVVSGNEAVTAHFVPAQCQLTINVVGSGTAGPASGTYNCGSTINLSATAGSGYTFGQWSGGGYSGTNPSGSFILATDTTETATFVQGSSNCNLSTSVTGSGSITLSPSGGSYSCGTSITITAVPFSTDWTFTGFGGVITGTTNPQTIVLNATASVSAAFTQTSFPINLTVVGPGTVASNPSAASYAQGTQVQLTATPNSGAHFVGYTGDVSSTNSVTNVTVDTTKNITATFANSIITTDGVSHAATSAANSTLSWSHTLGNGTNRAVIIAIGSTDAAASPDANAVVTSVLFNGVYATAIPNSLIFGGTSGMVQTQLFYLTDAELPPAGTYTVQVNLAGSIGGFQAGAISFFGVSQGPAEAVFAHKDTSGADLISSQITTLTNNAVVVDVVEDNNVAALTANAGQNLAWTQSSAGSGSGGSSTKTVAVAGSTTLGWAGSASRLTHSLAAFAPATAVVPPTYTLTTSTAGGTGTVTTNPGISTLPTQTAVLLTANPGVGYAFNGWTGDFTSAANPLPIIMDANHSVTANFTAVGVCNLTINIIGQGTVSPAPGAYNCGSTIRFVATPASGYTFTSYSGDYNSPITRRTSPSTRTPS